MKIIAFLPAKGTSSRIENKNIKLLDGKPLFLHTLEKLVACDFIDEVYLDSESEEIFSLAENVKCNFLKRDVSLATNMTDGHSLFYNEAKQVEADIYIQILGTSPFIKKELYPDSKVKQCKIASLSPYFKSERIKPVCEIIFSSLQQF